jgi:hypothetical protein
MLFGAGIILFCENVKKKGYLPAVFITAGYFGYLPLA